MNYYKEYIKYKIKYFKLKEKLGGLTPSTIDLFFSRPITRLYEIKYYLNCSFLPNYDYHWVNLKKKLSDEILDKVEKYHILNNYQKEGFNEIKNLYLNNILTVPNNTVFTYILFPNNGNDNLKKFGFDTDLDIRFHRVDSAFELNTKHDYIIDKYAQKNNIDKSKQLVYCGGEFKIEIVNNEPTIKVNNNSGTIPNCWKDNAPEVNLTDLFNFKTGFKTYLLENSMLDKTSNDYVQFHEDFKYLNKLNELGIELDFYKSCPSQWDNEDTNNPVSIKDIKYIQPQKNLTLISPQKLIKNNSIPVLKRKRKGGSQIKEDFLL